MRAFRTPLSLTLATLLVAQPALAQSGAADPSDTEKQIEAIKLATEKTKAETEQIKQENEQFKTRIDALGLPKPEGKTTLGTKGGELEGSMLASGTLATAAAAIDRKVVAAGGPILLLDKDDAVDLRIGELLRFDIEALDGALKQARDDAKCDTGDIRTAAAAFPVLPAIGTLLSLLKTDTVISGFSFDTPDGALLNAIAGTTSGKYLVPGDLIMGGPNGKTLDSLRTLLGKADNNRACRIRIAGAASTDAAKKAAAPRLAALDAVATRADAFVTAITDRKDGKPSRLEAAMLADALLEGPPIAGALRVQVEKAGGSILQRSNLFTMLGAPAVGITGGAVISWRLSDPKTGIAGGGGILVCRTKLTNLNAIHRGDVRPSSCSPDVSVPQTGARQ